MLVSLSSWLVKIRYATIRILVDLFELSEVVELLVEVKLRCAVIKDEFYFFVYGLS
jgi:hypothetical protein